MTEKSPSSGQSRRAAFLTGARDAIPVGLGYLAASFSIGIACRDAGVNVLQGALISLTCVASAGEYAGLTVIAENSGLISIIAISIVANIRYLLMGCALAPRLDPKLSLPRRLAVGYALTDEIFGLEIAQRGYVDPFYYYGTVCTSVSLWVIGTVLGIVLGSLLPPALSGGFSVMLFGMFIAIIVPPAKENRVVAGVVILAMLLSFIASHLSFMTDAMSVLLITVGLSAAAALLFPVKEEEKA